MELKREIDAALLAGLSGNEVYPALLVYIDWPGDPVYAHSGVGSLSWNSQTWQGAGEVAGMSIPEEGTGLAQSSAELILASSIDSLLDDAANAAARNATAEIHLALTTTPGGTTLIGEPLRVFTGAVDGSDDPDTIEVAEGGEVGLLRVRLRSGQPARAAAQITHSDEAQQIAYPGDEMFRRVAHAAKWRSNPPQWPAP